MSIEHTFYGRDGLITKELSALKAVRNKCLECSNFSTEEVKMCTVTHCALYPFRFGKDPGRKSIELSEEQKEILRNRLAGTRKS